MINFVLIIKLMTNYILVYNDMQLVADQVGEKIWHKRGNYVVKLIAS